MMTTRFRMTALAVAAALLASSPLSAAGLDDLQAKVDTAAREAGVPAPDVRKELAADAAQKKTTDKKVAPITKIVAIDTDTLRAIQSDDGRIMYVLDNGRFAFVGKMIDVWERKELNTIADIENAVNHIRLEKLGFSLDKVNHFSVGSGEKHITAFVDPQCGWCHKLMQEVSANPELFKTYTFDFVVVPVLGPRSEKLAKRLYCAKDADDGTKFRLMLGGASSVESLEEDPSCDTAVYEQTRVIAGAIGVQSVPMVVAHDGRFEKGKPRDLMAFLENRPQSDLAAGKGGATKTADDGAERVDLAQLGFDLAKTNHMALGNGPRHVTAFVDPLCTWCHRLMEDIRKDPKLLDEFTFDFVVVPVLGAQSQALSKKLFCAKSQDDAVRFKALEGGAETIDALEQVVPCDMTGFSLANAEAKKSTVQAVPLVVADDGHVSRGKPRNLRAFLKAER